MTQAISNLVTFDGFIKWYPNNGIPYELHDGTIVEMAPPTGDHENCFMTKSADVSTKKLISLAPDNWVRWVTQIPDAKATAGDRSASRKNPA